VKNKDTRICVLPSVVKKKIVAAASTEAFPTAGLALQVEVSTAATSIPGLNEGGGGGVLELWLGCPIGGGDGQYPAATSKSERLRETLPTASRVLDPYENHIT
jgi:hypothetical protein